MGLAQPAYVLTRVGPDDDATIRTEASAIDKDGRIVGTWTDPNEDLAFLWDASADPQIRKLEHLGDAGFGAADAAAINDNGQIAGSSYTGQWDYQHAFYWDDAATPKVRDLGTLTNLYGTSLAADINNAGKVVGASIVWGYTFRAFLWDSSASPQMKNLGTLPGGVDSKARGINNSGQVVGDSVTGAGVFRAFVWESGASPEMQDLGTLGGDGSFASAINDLGQVVGCSNPPSQGYTHAYLWDEDASPKMKDLGIFATGDQSCASAINNSGQVVGTGTIDRSYSFRAALWHGGQIYNLNDRITSTDPLKGCVTLTQAVGINDAGQIAVNGTDTCVSIGKSVKRAYLMTPVAASEPVVSMDAGPDSQGFGQEVTITATVTGNAAIASVEYTLAQDGSGWTSMAYDSDAGTWTAKVTPEGAGAYLACVKATDVNGLSSATNFADDDTDDATQTDECDDFDVTPVQLAIVYSGDTLDLNGAPTRLEATVSGGPSSCYDGEPVPFAWSDDDDGSSTNDGSDSDDADALGVATRDVNLALGHVYEVLVSIGSLDVNDDDTDDCLGSDNESNVAGVTVADPNAASTGGGWYKVDGATPPRVNFGYTAQRKYDRKLKEWFTSGNLLLINQESWRLKGKVAEGGVLPSCPSADFAKCAAFRGSGMLYEWDKVNDEWVNGRPVTFTFLANDGGTSKVCTTNAKGKSTCKDVTKPDAFGIEIDQETVDAESGPVLLMGGGLVVK